MKSLKFLSVFLIASLAFSFTGTAQTYKEKKVYSKTSDTRIHTYNNSKWHVVTTQKESTATTTDSTLTYIDTITVASNEAGILDVQVIGYNDSLSIAVTGRYMVRYKKVAGTLTLGTPEAVLTTEVDTGLQNGTGGATFSIVAASNQIYVRIKGKVPYNIYWECLRTQQKKVP